MFTKISGLKNNRTHNKKNNRAQIQLGESVAIIIIIIFLLIIGIVFWNKLKASDIKQTGQEQEELSVIDIAKTIQEMPELRCSSTQFEKVNCFDMYKILAFKNSFSTENRNMFNLYNFYFRHSKITFREIYPDDKSIIIYDFNVTNQTKRQIDIPINIYDPITKQTSFGVITVEGYST